MDLLERIENPAKFVELWKEKIRTAPRFSYRRSQLPYHKPELADEWHACIIYTYAQCRFLTDFLPTLLLNWG